MANPNCKRGAYKPETSERCPKGFRRSLPNSVNGSGGICRKLKSQPNSSPTVIKRKKGLKPKTSTPKPASVKVPKLSKPTAKPPSNKKLAKKVSLNAPVLNVPKMMNR